MTEGLAVLVELRDGSELALDLRDGSIDASEIRRAVFKIHPDDAVLRIRRELEELPNSLEPELAIQWKTELEAAERYFHDRPDWGASIARLLGELAERVHKSEAALVAYQRAIGLNPRVGVAKRIKTLGGNVPVAPEQEQRPRPDLDRPYASTACPTCLKPLATPPLRKSPCPHCASPIHVRSGPDGQRHLLRSDQVAAHLEWIERDWQKRADERERAEERADQERRDADRRAGLLVGEYEPTVVDLASHQDALKRLIESRGDVDLPIECIVELMPDAVPVSRVDVLIDGALIGRLHDGDVADLASMLNMVTGQGRPALCRGRIALTRGGGSLPGVDIEGCPILSYLASPKPCLNATGRIAAQSPVGEFWCELTTSGLGYTGQRHAVLGLARSCRSEHRTRSPCRRPGRPAPSSAEPRRRTKSCPRAADNGSGSEPLSRRPDAAKRPTRARARRRQCRCRPSSEP